jgi:flagellar protein FlaJ
MLTYYTILARKLFGWVPKKYPEITKPVKSSLSRSGIRQTPKNYISIVLLTTFISYIISLPLILFLVTSVFELNIFLMIITIIFGPIIIGMVVFTLVLFYPYQKVLSRSRSIDTNLPFAIAHMGAIAASGVPPTSIFKLLSEFKEYDVLAEEMKKIVRNIEVFGLDPMSAMREVADRSPSNRFKQLLLGLVSTIEGGGDLKTYLRNAGEQSLFTWRMKRQKYLQQLSAYAEFYTGLLIAAPLFIISLFSVMYMIQPELGGYDILTLMRVSIYILVPTLNIGFLIFLHSTQIEM